MKYHNVIIKFKGNYGEELQKYLFGLGYYYIVKGRKDRNIIDSGPYNSCIVIKNDRSMSWKNENFMTSSLRFFPERYTDFKILEYPNCLRLDKLKRLNKLKIINKI